VDEKPEPTHSTRKHVKVEEPEVEEAVEEDPKPFGSGLNPNLGIRFDD
jgi:hypothetical protein